MRYPIHDIVDDIRKHLASQNNLIVQAEPGAGKSTVLPLELMNEDWIRGRKIVMLEPRRLAARSIAYRMAELLDEKVGQRVGYRIRFESKVSGDTVIEVVTEAILIRMIQQDSALAGIAMIIFDEFHERSLHADLSFALSQQVQGLLREDLKIMIMSATLDTEKLSVLLNNAPVARSKGKIFPVEIIYVDVDKRDSIIGKTVETIRRALRDTIGDILVFLPGAGEIRSVSDSLSGNVAANVFALYGDLPFEKQKAAIERSTTGERKVVLSTNIAETSLTIEGITVVIDTGLRRSPHFDVRSGLTRLETVRITMDSADQRAGRAGRLEPGKCYRLWSKPSHALLQPFRKPEILEADLASFALELMQWGVTSLDDLVWITRPPEGAYNQALDLLESLEAVDKGRITERGKEMAAIPTHPRIAHMLLSGTEEKQKQLTCDVAALLEERDPISGAGADFALRVAVLRDYRRGDRVNADRIILARIEKLSASWRRYFRVEADNGPVSEFDVGKMIAAAYPERVAKQEGHFSPRYKLANGRVALVEQNDPIVHFDWIVASSVDAGKDHGKIFLAAPIDPDNLKLSHESEVVAWDEDKQRIVASAEKVYMALVLETKKLPQVPENKKNDVWCRLIRERGLRFMEWGEEVLQFQARVMSLRAWRTTEAWPDVSDQYLLDTLEQWLVPHLSGVTRIQELRNINYIDALMSLVPWDLQGKLNLLAPGRMTVPSGSSIKLRYFSDGRAPELAVRLQELFGMIETPMINGGRIPILLHLLSPGYKPMQITQDLKSFWHNAYFEVRKELRRRYPKHAWPEDPLAAQPVRGVRKTK